MKTELIKKFGNEYFKVELSSFVQKNKEFFLAKIPAKDFVKIYTVEPAEYDIEKHAALAASFYDDESYYEYLVKDDKERIDSKSFQRKESRQRISEIANFLEKEEYAIFPNTIISTCELLNDTYDCGNLKFEELGGEGIDAEALSRLAFLEEIEGQSNLYIPNKKSSILVIDGQHRLKGLSKALEEGKIDDFELLVAFIIKVDRPVIAKLFYTINYTQKTVNKSLLYHLSGEFSRNIDQITFWHEVVKLLNELHSSPFYKRIKMLGVVPRDLGREDKARMTISQAFLIDHFKRTISRDAVQSIYQPIFLYYYQNEKLRIEIVRFIINYFSAIRDLKRNDWESPLSNGLSKTVGIGAFIRILHFLFIKMLFDEFKGDFNAIAQVTKDEIKHKIAGFECIDFSGQGEFGGVGGSGNIIKLKSELVETIPYFNSDSYSTFIDDYKKNYHKRFKDLLLNKVK